MEDMQHSRKPVTPKKSPAERPCRAASQHTLASILAAAPVNAAPTDPAAAAEVAASQQWVVPGAAPAGRGAREAAALAPLRCCCCRVWRGDLVAPPRAAAVPWAAERTAGAACRAMPAAAARCSPLAAAPWAGGLGGWTLGPEGAQAGAWGPSKAGGPGGGLPPGERARPWQHPLGPLACGLTAETAAAALAGGAWDRGRWSVTKPTA
mmetsp:Transcript_36425/g.102889  ORF Transcript_36425/g.102889 Transcript_36425/m.102889 type:complete len:208 (-) Transcript_36425:1468-2091(-)